MPRDILAKYTIYLAQSVDGFIADLNNNTPWSTKEWDLFANYVKTYKNLVIGRKTYEIMLEGGEFKVVKPKQIFVLSRQEYLPKAQLDIPVIIVNKITDLPKEEHFLIAGGKQTVETFLQAGLVDSIVLDIEFLFLQNGLRIEWPKQLLGTLKPCEQIPYFPYSVQIRFCRK